MKKIVMTGGGTAGHVTPNIALAPRLQKEGYAISYIGSKAGIEKELILAEKLPYYAISSGKLRRYLSLQNLTDVARVVKGIGQARKLIRQLKPHVIFSKGGFVSVPVAVAGKLCGVPVIIHESDMTPGLANKIAMPFAAKVCASFPETMAYLPKDKAALTGAPIRKSLFLGDRQKGLKLGGFSGHKPVLLVMGGSLGSIRINEALRNILDKLLMDFDVLHLCGKGNKDLAIHKPGYTQFEYISDDLPHVFACADLVLSRAGANAIFELLALKKPNLLIPLSKNASRGDQILNASSFEKQGFSMVLQEEDLTETALLKALLSLYQNQKQYLEAMAKTPLKDGVSEVTAVIRKCTKDYQ